MIFSQFTLDELTAKIYEKLKPEFQNLSIQKSPQKEVLLTSKQSATLLRISLPTLHKWKIEGRINFYRIGTRIRFKESELLSALGSSQVKKGGRIKAKQ